MLVCIMSAYSLQKSAKVVQEVGQFGPKVLENRMLRDVGRVFIGRVGGPNRFSQGGETTVIMFAAM